jgi:muramoyltetrapeptide carboxypeptidase
MSGWRKSPNDRGYSLASMLERIRAATRTPILTGLAFGHVATKVTMPVGAKVRLLVDRRQAFLGWD